MNLLATLTALQNTAPFALKIKTPSQPVYTQRSNSVARIRRRRTWRLDRLVGRLRTLPVFCPNAAKRVAIGF